MTGGTFHGTVKTWLAGWVSRWRPPADPEPTVEPESERLIDRLDVLVDAYCPCGSRHIHHLTLTGTSDCARCGRTLAIRSIEYVRHKFSEHPTPQVSVGFVLLPDALRRRATRGVH